MALPFEIFAGTPAERAKRAEIRARAVCPWCGGPKDTSDVICWTCYNTEWNRVKSGTGCRINRHLTVPLTGRPGRRLLPPQPQESAMRWNLFWCAAAIAAAAFVGSSYMAWACDDHDSAYRSPYGTHCTRTCVTNGNTQQCSTVCL